MGLIQSGNGPGTRVISVRLDAPHGLGVRSPKRRCRNAMNRGIQVVGDHHVCHRTGDQMQIRNRGLRNEGCGACASTAHDFGRWVEAGFAIRQIVGRGFDSDRPQRQATSKFPTTRLRILVLQGTCRMGRANQSVKEKCSGVVSKAFDPGGKDVSKGIVVQFGFEMP